MRLAAPIACQETIDWTYWRWGAINKSARFQGALLALPRTVQTPKLMTSQPHPRPANMRMIGFTRLIHLNAGRGDGDSLGSAGSRRHKPMLCVAFDESRSLSRQITRAEHDWRKT